MALKITDHMWSIGELIDAALATQPMLAKQGVSEPTGKDVRNLYGAIQRSLQSHDGRSVTRVGEGMPARWAIAGQTLLAP